MPWVEVNGEKKKVACGPCIRGHRSSKCEHKDRVLLEVRKPGRPLSSCPHPPGSCSCERVVINYTVPKKADCKCTSSNSTPTGPIATPTPASNGSNRVQKPRAKRNSTSITRAALDRALKASESVSSDTSTQVDSAVVINSSESSAGASPGSSQPSDTESQQPTIKQETRASQRNGKVRGSCCNPAPDDEVEDEDLEVANTSSCCSSKPKEPSTTMKTTAGKKSCCGGKQQNTVTQQAISIPTIQRHYPAITHIAQPQPPFNAPIHGMSPPYTNGHGHYVPYQSNGHHIPMSPYGLPNGVPPPNSYFPHPLQFASGQAAPIMLNGASQDEHNCNCGDGCSCLGCATHPRNDTTMEYIRYYSQYLPGSSLIHNRPPQYAYQNPYLVPNGHAIPPFAHQIAMSNGHDMSHMYIPPRPHGTSHPHSHNEQHWQSRQSQTSVHATPTSELEHFNFLQDRSMSSQSHSSARANGQQTTPTMNVRESIEEEAEESEKSNGAPSMSASPILSPSSFFLQSLELPGCDDPTGTCQCGDGCACVGCLTHGGHTGELLDASTEETDLNFSYAPELSGAFVSTPG